MLSTATAIQFVRITRTGRTGPIVLVAERPNGDEVELVVKFTAGCDMQEASLAREAIGAELGADLGLPVPEAFAVELTPDFVAAIPDAAVRQRLGASCSVAFGSKLMTGQYSVWSPSMSITTSMVPTAAAIFAFDAIVQNSDRRDINPNCLVRDMEFRIFDHELAFSHGLVLGWQPPWQLGGLSHFATPGAHIFRRGLHRRDIDFEPIRAAWSGLGDGQIAGYASALPNAWQSASAAATAAVDLIAGARDQIDSCIIEMRRVLECPAS